MSNFLDFTYDFPRRCIDVLQLAEKPAHEGGREVTLLLMTACTAFLVAFEHLHFDKGQAPSFRDPHIGSSRQQLKEVLDKSFLGSPFWLSHNPSSWAYGEIAPGTWRDQVGSDFSNRRPVTKDRKVTSVLRIIRNALGHGNLATIGSEKIEHLVLGSTVTEGSQKFQYLCVTPQDFRVFLGNWFSFLEIQHISQNDAIEVLGTVSPI